MHCAQFCSGPTMQIYQNSKSRCQSPILSCLLRQFPFLPLKLHLVGQVLERYLTARATWALGRHCTMPTDFWRNDISGSLSPLKKTWQQEEHHIMKLGMRPLSTMTLVWCTRHMHRAGHLQVCCGFCRRRCSPALPERCTCELSQAQVTNKDWRLFDTKKICRTCIQARHGMRHRCTPHTVRALEVQTLLVARTTIVSCQASRWPGTKCRSFMILTEPGHSKLDFQRLLCSRRKENINLEGHVLRREVRHTAPADSCPTCHVQSAKVCWILTHRALPRRNALCRRSMCQIGTQHSYTPPCLRTRL